MKKSLFITSIIALFFSNLLAINANCNPALNPPTPGREVKLTAGTLIYFELVNDVNPSTAQIGNLIQLKVRANVYAEGKVAIRANMMAMGRITEVTRPSATSGGIVKIEVRDVQAVDGQMVNLNATYQYSPEPNPGTPGGAPMGFIMTAHVMNDQTVTID